MKIRTGFVSNSSSSSFIVAFPKRINKIEDLEGLLDLDQQDLNRVFIQIQNQHGFSAKKLKNILNTVSKLRKELTNKTKSLEELLMCDFDDIKYIENDIKSMLKLTIGQPNSVLYKFEFEDSHLEDPSTFEELPNIWKSQH